MNDWKNILFLSVIEDHITMYKMITCKIKIVVLKTNSNS